MRSVRRDVRILIATACLGSFIVWGDQVRETVAGLAAFRIEGVEVQGLRYLTRDEVVDLLGLTSESSVWGETEIWADRLLAHPLVKDVRITRQPPNGLRLAVTERVPIALAPTPTLEPVDAEGYRLPIDPAEYRLDLPLIHTTRTPPRASRLVPEDVRLLVDEVEHLVVSDTAFLQLVSSVEWDDSGAVVARWSDPPVAFYLPRQTPPARLREGLSALADAVARDPEATPVAIDLRFVDQVVVRRRSSAPGS